MTFRWATLTRHGFVVASLAAFSFFGYGCGGSSNPATLSAQFTASVTPPNILHRIKLVQKSASGARIVVQTVIYGPDVTLDMYAFAFDVKIGDTSVVRYVPGSAVAGNALVPTAGQGVQVLAEADMSDPSHIVVGVTKTGGPPGNGIAGQSADIVDLTFEVLKAGTSTLTLTGDTSVPSNPPTVLDSSSPPQPITGPTFDSSSASMTGISTGGGGY
jgi:hypothetical protein